jgi:hypothetical protein
MFGRFVRTLLAVALAGFLALPAAAQDRIAPGYMDLGIWLGGGQIDGATMSYQARMERLVKELPSLGGGVLGVQLSVGGHSYPFGLGHHWVFFPLGVSANYHFSPGSGRLDPYAALGLGIKIAYCDRYPVTWYDCTTEKNEFMPIARVGAKMFISDVTAITLDAGLGAALISGGFTFRIK